MLQSWLAGDPDEQRLSLTLGVELDGTMAEFMVLPENGVVVAPAHLSDEEAAALPTAGVTAWRALVTEGRSEGGRHGLGARYRRGFSFRAAVREVLGAFVIVTWSSDSKLDRARTLGADATINYLTTSQCGKAARQIARKGVDHIVEVGEQGTLPQSLRAVRADRTISMLDVLQAERWTDRRHT